MKIATSNFIIEWRLCASILLGSQGWHSNGGRSEKQQNQLWTSDYADVLAMLRYAMHIQLH